MHSTVINTRLNVLAFAGRPLASTSSALREGENGNGKRWTTEATTGEVAGEQIRVCVCVYRLIKRCIFVGVPALGIPALITLTSSVPALHKGSKRQRTKGTKDVLRVFS